MTTSSSRDGSRKKTRGTTSRAASSGRGSRKPVARPRRPIVEAPPPEPVVPIRPASHRRARALPAPGLRRREHVRRSRAAARARASAAPRPARDLPRRREHEPRPAPRPRHRPSGGQSLGPPDRARGRRELAGGGSRGGAAAGGARGSSRAQRPLDGRPRLERPAHRRRGRDLAGLGPPRRHDRDRVRRPRLRRRGRRRREPGDRVPSPVVSPSQGGLAGDGVGRGGEPVARDERERLRLAPPASSPGAWARWSAAVAGRGASACRFARRFARRTPAWRLWRLARRADGRRQGPPGRLPCPSATARRPPDHGSSRRAGLGGARPRRGGAQAQRQHRRGGQRAEVPGVPAVTGLSPARHAAPPNQGAPREPVRDDHARRGRRPTRERTAGRERAPSRERGADRGQADGRGRPRSTRPTTTASRTSSAGGRASPSCPRSTATAPCPLPVPRSLRLALRLVAAGVAGGAGAAVRASRLRGPSRPDPGRAARDSAGRAPPPLRPRDRRDSVTPVDHDDVLAHPAVVVGEAEPRRAPGADPPRREAARRSRSPARPRWRRGDGRTR